MSSAVSDAPAPASPAGLERRFYAEVIDRALAWVVYAAAAAAALALHLGWRGVGLVSGAVVVVWVGASLLTGLAAATPGKALLGLQVVDATGAGRIGVPRAALRQLVLGAAGAPTIGIGLGVLAWTALTDPSGRRRGWHDRLTRARVVDARPPEPVVEAPVDRPRPILNLTAMRLAPAPEVAAAPLLPPAPPPPPPNPSPPNPSPPAPSPAAPSPAAPSPAAPSPAVQPAAHAVDPAAWTVSFDTGEQLVVTGLVLVGRNPQARADEPPATLLSLASTDMSLSKTHAQVQVASDGALVVMDRGSTNGSTLVRAGVTRPLGARKPATLRAGDVVHFGDRSMRVARG